jgi:hypothetical protein
MPEGTPNMHFLGFSFHLKLVECLEGLVEVID